MRRISKPYMAIALEQQIMGDEKKRWQQSYSSPGFHLNQSWKSRIAADSPVEGEIRIYKLEFISGRKTVVHSPCFYMLPEAVMSAYTSSVS